MAIRDWKRAKAAGNSNPPERLDQIAPEQEIGRVTADGAQDTRKCRDAIANRCANAVAPPGKYAKPWKTATLRSLLHSHPKSRIDDRMPWNFSAASTRAAQGIAVALAVRLDSR